MDKLALADVFVYDGKRGAGHTASKPHALCHASHEGGFSGSEVAVHGNNGSVGEILCKLFAYALRFRFTVAYIRLH